MKVALNISIRRRIYLSFLLFVFLFVVNGVITIHTLNNNRELSKRLSGIIDPSLQSVDDFRKLVVESKMYITNWVFLSSREMDKVLLKKLHDTDYHRLKSKLNIYSSQWETRRWIDSLNSVYDRFEGLLSIEKTIMGSLKSVKDYGDPIAKLEARRNLEEEILPRTAAVLNSLNTIYTFGLRLRADENQKLEKSAMQLRMMIIILAITMICVGIILSMYMTKVIIGPINRIRYMLNDLGKGITQKISQNGKNDEIGMMIQSVNHLSEKLQTTATFAHEVGLRNFDMPFRPLGDEDTLGKALLAMRENLKNDEANLEIQNKELERKNIELEQFAFVASHDLQEPIRTTSSFVELLQKEYDGKLDERGNKYLDYIAQSSDRMKVLINDLLEYSRIGSKKELKQVDCNIVMNEVLADLGSAITEARAEITIVNLPVIGGYPTELKQLFQNLIMNAIKFTKKNISPQISISVRKIIGYWQFAFVDNGIGIPKEHNERIFVIFQRLHSRNEYNGSGIGLSHCKKIVELHKGKIWVESTPGEGSTFHFTIKQNNIL
jgi:signal transduction histidine kinase